MEKIKWSENVTNEEAIERIGEKRALRNYILKIIIEQNKINNYY